MKLTIASPCAQSWEGMTGSDRVRFCGACRKKVFNLSDLPEREALSLVGQGPEAPCVRFFQRADGTVMTSDCPSGRRRRWWGRLAGAAAALGVALLAVLLYPSDRSCGSSPEWFRELMSWINPKPEEPVQMTMGKPVPPPPPPLPPPPAAKGDPEAAR